MNDSMDISLRIDRGTSAGLVDEPLLEAAGRALAEAHANLNHASLQAEQTLTQQQVIALSHKLASEAWDANELLGEAPILLLHEESSGWQGSDPEAENIPLLILAADVLNCVALVMGTNDALVLEVQK